MSSWKRNNCLPLSQLSTHKMRLWSITLLSLPNVDFIICALLAHTPKLACSLLCSSSRAAWDETLHTRVGLSTAVLFHKCSIKRFILSWDGMLFKKSACKFISQQKAQNFGFSFSYLFALNSWHNLRPF